MGKVDPARMALVDADEVYRVLIEAHRGLDDAASADFNARLILVLASQLGDVDVLRDAVSIARQTGEVGAAG